MRSMGGSAASLESISRFKRIARDVFERLAPPPLNAAALSGRIACLKEKSDGCEAVQTRGDNPRGHVVSNAFATVIEHGLPKTGDDTEQAKWVRDWSKTSLAFDHRQILMDAARSMLQRRKIQPPSIANGGRDEAD